MIPRYDFLTPDFLTFSPNVPFFFFVQFIYTVQSLTIVLVSIDLLTIKIIMAIKDPNSTISIVTKAIIERRIRSYRGCAKCRD